jgi:uncharacterized protein (TIGR02217 family)
MSFLNARFPDRIAFGAQRSPAWATAVAQTSGGYSSTNAEWAHALHSFDVSLSVRVLSDYEAVKTHHHEVRGRHYSFPFKDFADFICLSSAGVMTLTSGSVYQLGKVYGIVNAYTRRITRPLTGTCTFYRTRASVQTVIAPSVDYATGLVTVSGHVSGDTYQWAGQFDVPCRYAHDTLPAVMVNKEPGLNGELFVEVDSIQLVEDRE